MSLSLALSGGYRGWIATSSGNAGMSFAAYGACQPTGCAPIARYLSGELAEIAVDTCETGISALQLPDPPDGRLAVDAVIASSGWGSAVGDAEILSAQRLLASTEGIFVEPAAAAALASLIADVKRGGVGPSDHPVLLLTGAGWKDLSRFAGDADRLPTVELAGAGDRIDAWASSL